MRLSDVILAGKALLRRDAPAEPEAPSMPQRVFKGSRLVDVPNKIRKRFGRAKR